MRMNFLDLSLRIRALPLPVYILLTALAAAVTTAFGAFGVYFLAGESVVKSVPISRGEVWFALTISPILESWFLVVVVRWLIQKSTPLLLVSLSIAALIAVLHMMLKTPIALATFFPFLIYIGVTIDCLSRFRFHKTWTICSTIHALCNSFLLTIAAFLP
jgi:hypothetical protein